MAHAKTLASTLLGNWTDLPCFYVNIHDAGRNQVVLGPFQTEAACREWAYREPEEGGTHMASKLRDIANKLDPKSWFYAWGMVKLANGHREGVLNKYVRKDGLWNGEAFEIVPTQEESHV